MGPQVMSPQVMSCWKRTCERKGGDSVGGWKRDMSVGDEVESRGRPGNQDSSRPRIVLLPRNNVQTTSPSTGVVQPHTTGHFVIFCRIRHSQQFKELKNGCYYAAKVINKQSIDPPSDDEELSMQV